MDWTRAKNILIVAFIITNLILGYALYQLNSQYSPFDDSKYVKSVLKRLEEKNIEVNINIVPKNTPKKKILTMEYDIKNPKDMAEKLLGKEYEVRRDKKSKRVYYENLSEKIWFEENRELNYTNNSSSQNYGIIDLEQAKKISKEFIKKMGFEDENMKLTWSKKRSGSYFITYTKTHEDLLVEKSYMTFTVDKFGVRSFKRLWMNFLEEGTYEEEIRDALTALLRLSTYDDTENKKIVEIEACYYFDPNSEEAKSYSTRTFQTSLAWKISFADGTIIFIKD